MSEEEGQMIEREFDDEPAGRCELCGQEMPMALIAEHLSTAHYINSDDIASAPVVDKDKK